MNFNTAIAAPTYSDPSLPKVTAYSLSQEIQNGNIMAVLEMSIRTHSNELISINGDIGLLGHIGSPLIAPCEPAFRIRINSQDLNISKIGTNVSAGYTTTNYKFILPISNTPNGGNLCRGNYQLMDLHFTDEASHEISLFDFRFAPNAGGRSGVAWAQNSEVWSVSPPPCPPAEPITQYLGPVWKSACDFEVDFSQSKIDLSENIFSEAEKIKKEANDKLLAEKNAVIKLYSDLQLSINDLFVRIRELGKRFPSQVRLLVTSQQNLSSISSISDFNFAQSKKYFDQASKLVLQYEQQWPRIAKSISCVKNKKKLIIIDVKPTCPPGYKPTGK
ncbi:MAG: hypothetical protein F2519_05970 [Actinobacteria bacterium]|nr:hypothetical protein [Actinomycetota bacterium]